MDENTIIVVSGLPRSGTSMMMSMLEAGGLEIVTDNVRTADDDNPNGYYEQEKVKGLNRDDDKLWLSECKGKAIKIISQLLTSLPEKNSYKIIFMQRKMEEVLASQKQMLIRRGEPTDRISDEKLARLFNKHLEETKKWLTKQPGIDVLYISYNDLFLYKDKLIEDIKRFLICPLLRTDMMKCVIDKSLYRQRS
ncbi:type I phosphodiesterase/nucleotide pyrophosphatase [Candidatus Scalindua japonica]|uniref:Type I phosphodiesterase/nucleotide pyrophosphatase n=1 Tax=Candidatus Scalindua japonica TaxID=1284222 RepID=A0A286TX43_9BACT|nr:sulfotransferase domain-containing protein [Candidatus Scalindua japonica]GAX60455.1 type I phosphodiesterase/nucleotide pyrophosphatase [Candidatus Scalindua japonica]